jgi:spermidine synthase
VRDYYLFSKLSPERVEYAESTIKEKVPVVLNRDFRPISYYYATVFWGTQFDAPFFRRFLTSLKGGNIWLVTILFCALFAVICLAGRQRRNKRAVLLAVATTGFAEINFQIVTILSFQVIYGFVFYKLGVIITSFMVGLAFGGWIIAKYMPRVKDDLKLFSWTQVSICLYPLILPPLFLAFSRSGSDTVSWWGTNVVFPFLPVIAGIIGGIQFPLANKIYLEQRSEMGRVAGLTYGLDLLGACLGSLLAAAFLIPILGIFQTCFLVAFINFIVLAILLPNIRK